MDKKGSHIMEGEAIESDEEVTNYEDFMKNTIIRDVTTETKNEGPSSSVVVSGEASESDDEVGDYILGRSFPSLQNQEIDDLVPEEYTITIETKKPRFESPFHKRIWEDNFAFRLGIVQLELDKYNHVSSCLNKFIPIANRSQTHAQEALKHYRTVSTSARELNDNLENLLHGTDLPAMKEPERLET